MHLFDLMMYVFLYSMMALSIVLFVVFMPLLLLGTLLMYVSPKFYRLIVGKTGGTHATL